MKKKTLVSILAVASAPMAGYANANLDQIKTDAVTDWTGPADLTLENNVLTSPSGLAVSQNIGQLLPGTYQLTAGTGSSSNITISVNGAPLENNQFTLETATEVTIRIGSTDGSSFTVAGLELQLVANFNELYRQPLLTELGKVQVRINQDDPSTAAALNDAVSELSAKIATITDDATGVYKAYDVYKNFELYKGWAESTIMAEITALGERVDGQANNSGAYLAAMNIAKAQQDALDAEKARVDDYADDLKTYANTIAKAELDAAQGRIDTYKTTAEEAYAAGTAGTVCTNAFNEAFQTEVTALITAYADKLTAAEADHAAYVEIADRIAALKNTYNAAVQYVYDALEGSEIYPDVYEPVRQEAQTKLNEQYVDILGVERQNGTAEDHTNAAETLEANRAALTTAENTINSLKDEYSQKANALKNAYSEAQTLLTNLQASLDEVAAFEGVAEGYQADIDNIQAMIDALAEKIKADNEANTIDVSDYTQDEDEVNDAIEELVEKAVGSVDNYNAYKAVQGVIADMQNKLNEAKNSVNALASEDGNYTVSGKYAAKETEIQTSLNTFTTQMTEALHNNTCVQWQIDNQSKIEAVGGVIEAYESTAEDGVAAYEAVVTALAEYDVAIKALEDKVGTNRDVAVYDGDEPTTVTYGQRIDELRATYNLINNKKNDALTKSGDEHYKLLTDARTLVTTGAGTTVVSEANALVSTFDADKAKYDVDVVEIAVERLLNQAEAYISGAEAQLDNWTYTSTDLGLNYDALNDRLEVVRQQLGNATAEVDAARTNTDKAEAMATLSVINGRLSTITTEISNLLADAEKVAAAVKANNEAKTNADKVVAEINEQLNGKSDNTPKGVFDLNEDDSRDDEFNTMVSELAGKISEQVTAITASYEKETLVADWTGINEKLTAIREEVMNARTAAENSTMNWNAYLDITTLASYTQLTSDIATARTDVETVTADPADPSAQDHYMEMWTSYDTEWTKLTANIQKSYATDRDCATKQTEYTNQLNTLQTNVKALKGLAEANEKAYYEQIGENYYAKVNTSWEDTYYAISTGDQTSAVQGYLNELTQQQTLLLNVSSQIREYFIAGQSVEKDAAVKESLSNIQTTITDIAKRQEEGYNEAVATDNMARMDRITAAISNARTEYTEALAVITGFTQLQLQDADLVEMLAGYVGTANETINGYLTQLRTIENEAQTTYASTAAGEMFDENEDYLQSVNAIADGIAAALDKMNSDVVTNIVDTYFPQEYATHKALYDAAVQALVDANYTEGVRETAFADVKEILDAAKRDMDGVEEGATEFLPLVVDQHLTNFAKIESMIAVDQENAALAEWTAESTRIQNRIDNELNDMNTWGYPSTFNKDNYITQYENAVTAYFEPAKEVYAEAVAAGTPLYGDVIAELKDYIQQFEGIADVAYGAAETANGEKTESDEAYTVIIDLIEAVQAQWTAAKTYLDNYVVTSQYETLWRQQELIDALLEQAAECKELGTCVTFETSVRTSLTAIENNLTAIYSNANTAEETRILSEFNVLRGEQNKAADAVEGSDKVDEVDAYISAIDAMQEQFEKDITGPDGAIYKAETKAKQALYLAYETQMADMRTELTAYYDEAQATNAYNALVEKAGQIEADWTTATENLNSMHQPVIDEYGAAMAAVGTSINAVKAEIELRNTEARILFYNDNLTFDLNAVAGDLAEVSAAAETMEAPYDENDAAYIRLTAEIKAVQDSLDNTVEKWNGYRYLYDNDREDIQQWADNMQGYIDTDTWIVESLNAQGTGLKESTSLINDDHVEEEVNTRDRGYTYSELSRTISWEVETSLNEAYAIIFNSGNLYIDTDRDQLVTSYWDLYTAVNALRDYNSNANTGTIYRDINGNLLVDEDGDQLSSKAIDYLIEAVPAVQEKIAELTEKLNTLKTDAEEKAFELGDADLDRLVTVNDYMEVISYVVGRQEMPELGTIEFAAADVNSDSKINIGDVTNIANIIRGEQPVTTFTASMLRSRAAVDRTIASTDAIALSMGEENGVQRIAIRLNNTRNYVGLQLDVQLPAGVTVMNETLGDRAADHELFSNTMADGTHRILISSLESSEFNNTDDAVIYLEVSGNNASKITVSNVLATDARGTVYSIGGQGGDGTTGIDGVEATQNLKQRIYSVGGQVMQKLTRGLNIIQNSDGTTKKVLKK